MSNSGDDLTGTKGKRFPVTLEELKKHNSREDCWIAIKGKVYNITRYLDFHPGGLPELMSKNLKSYNINFERQFMLFLGGAGVDATKLFDEFHPWVNIEQLLAKCFIGPLKTATLDINPFEVSSPKKSAKFSPKLLPPCREENGDSGAVVKVLPRYDWIQTTKNLTIYFYTKGFCNPGVTLTRKDDKNYEVEIYIGNFLHIYKFSFLKALLYPPKSFEVLQESGKIEILFEKNQYEVWNNFGTFEKIKSLQSNDAEYASWSECNVAKISSITHDSFEFIMRPKMDKIFCFPIGYHVSFKCMGFIRNYTPIPSIFLHDESSLYDLNFLIKRYEQGSFSKHIEEYKDVELFEISQQKGSLDLNNLKDHRKFLLLAAGSGITPFLHLILYLLERKWVESIILLFFNKTLNDIWCKDKLDELSDERFKVKYILSEPENEWTGKRGKIRKELIEEIIKEFSFALICGPKAFSLESLKILNELNVENVFSFDG